ncbi:MAG TPA: acetyl-CoA carboxylase biotin carboxylase subunit [Chryseosolibacter sp.]|nr:acetyl-CoA carboxylase biotin carboxylase subunit [Chryseosolibacter sp.]
MPEIKKILIANRGEIALRVMRSARELGIKTVAVFSEADRHALHVRYADESVYIGRPPSAESYLRIDKLIAAARSVGADAVHPGYGFLSEHAGFAQQCQDAGLIFIGPSPQSIDLMGSKLAAKATVAKFNVPLVPGTSEPITNVSDAKNIAAKIGYPVLIKASAGGGGKGMRIVEDESHFQQQMERAISEATSAFGDGSVFIEKYITKPRHIEFQVFGDKHGNVVHMFERECSIQRRHQKVVEEAPSAILTPEKRKLMGEAAINVARSCGYFGAGTVEFILDEKLDFYFLEMNTRLQVEHPVTEEITGLDLVKLQILVAAGEKLPFRQEDLTMHGHAIEARVYAEDPANNFLPDIGTLKTYKRPQGHGVRVDDGFEQGMDIPFYYDPMIAKLVCYGQNRMEAIDKMIRAIEEYEITGLETTLGFCDFVMKHDAFRSGNFDTNFIETHFTPSSLKHEPLQEEALIAALLATTVKESIKTAIIPDNKPTVSRWKKNRV